MKRCVAVWVLSIVVVSTWAQEVAKPDFVNCTRDDAKEICERVKCAPLTCEGEDREVHPKGSRCGCCDVCVKIVGKGIKCIDRPIDPNGGEPVPSTKCKAEFPCVNGVCGGTTGQDPEPATECLRRRKARENVVKTHPKFFRKISELWKPECDSEGNFKIKQCQHKRCFCVDRETGERIFGQEEVELAANMTCACSSRLHVRLTQMKKENEAEWHTYEQEHCTTSGDFHELQCYKDTCFCVNPQTGEPEGTMVKMSLRNLLPCYEAKLYKESYLKRCEKQLITERRIMYDFFQKGIKVIGLIDIDCEPDGSFTRRLCTPEICYCSDREGTSFGVYKKDKLDGNPDTIMQCRCARDEEDVKYHHKRYERLLCTGHGNYAEHQCFDDNCFCVDEHGDRITDMIPQKDVITEKGMNMKTYCEMSLYFLKSFEFPQAPNTTSSDFTDAFNITVTDVSNVTETESSTTTT